jgi:ABC-type hemin transport system ATPase subunit
MGNFEIMREDVVIAVMGPTGAGKSYFVQAATGDNSIEVGHTLQSGRLKNSIGKQILRAISDT